MNKTTNKVSPEVRERAVRMVDHHRADYGSEWAAITSIAGKIGCTAETLRRWCREEASPKGPWLAGPAAQTANDRDRLKLLEREVKELHGANEILRKPVLSFVEGAEVIWRQRSWPSASSVEMAILRWVDWFNNQRLFGPIGYIPPAEAKANYYAALENLDMVA